MADSDDALDDVSMDSDSASMHTSDEDFDESIPLNEHGRLRMRADINMEGPEYSGRKSSRLAAFESNGEELPVNQSLMDANGKNFNFEYEDDDDDDLLLGGRAGNGDDDQLEALNQEYEELRKQEEELVNRLKGKKSEDQGKGDAVRNQKVLWDRALEIRIAIQKLVTGVHCFPLMQGKDDSSETDIEFEKTCRMVTEAAATALDSFLELKQVLVEQNEAVTGSDSADLLRKRKGDFEDSVTEDGNSESLCDALWERMTSLYSRITPFRNSSVDRWQRKTQLATGAGAIKGKLQAFNQSISQQLTTVMRDPSQLIENICLRQPANQALVEDGIPVANHSSQDGNYEADASNPELVDDSDFYQQLLLEFLESSGASGIGGLQNARKRTKKRKIVDRRASKGRKIRYNVHEPLVNFMAPEPMVLPPMASKLFSNLFGQQAIAPVS